jgi:hypothetical protein
VLAHVICSANFTIEHGLNERAFAFQQFEEQFEMCISKSAILSKFAMHAERARGVTQRLMLLVKQLTDQAQQLLFVQYACTSV